MVALRDPQGLCRNDAFPRPKASTGCFHMRLSCVPSADRQDEEEDTGENELISAPTTRGGKEDRSGQLNRDQDDRKKSYMYALNISSSWFYMTPTLATGAGINFLLILTL